MKKEIVACDHCGQEMREGFVLKGSLKQTSGRVEDIGGEDCEMHFHEWCMIGKMFPDYNLVKKRTAKKPDATEGEGATKVFDDVDDVQS